MGACRLGQTVEILNDAGGVSRRAVLFGAAATVIGGVTTPQTVGADEQTETSQFSAAYKSFSAGRTVVDGPVVLELPELAENGNMVPFTVRVDSPMTPDDHVKTLTLFSTGNPQPIIASFAFSPQSGAARVSGRLRLARTQDLIAVAELNSGVLIKGTTKVAVNIGGCGAG
jgi:sulfur-oxidizing protein SoxY